MFCFPYFYWSHLVYITVSFYLFIYLTYIFYNWKPSLFWPSCILFFFSSCSPALDIDKVPCSRDRSLFLIFYHLVSTIFASTIWHTYSVNRYSQSLEIVVPKRCVRCSFLTQGQWGHWYHVLNPQPLGWADWLFSAATSFVVFFFFCL